MALSANNSEVSPRKNILGRIAVPVLLVGFAVVRLLWGLTNKYLWQDEAATAVLAERMLRFGRPLAYDRVNLMTIDYFLAEDPATIDQRTTNPQAATSTTSITGT